MQSPVRIKGGWIVIEGASRYVLIMALDRLGYSAAIRPRVDEYSDTAAFLHDPLLEEREATCFEVLAALEAMQHEVLRAKANNYGHGLISRERAVEVLLEYIESQGGE